MLRKLALSLAVAGVIASSQANALGLGDIRIKSALNEPLNAEIQLNQVRDLNPLQIRPRMATADEFDLAGLSQPRILSNVRFQVRVNPNGSGTIFLTSNEPVREPFLNFLVEVNWPSGRLIREYTVLLDPPVFDPTPTPRPIAPAISSAAAPVVAQPSLRKADASNIRTRMNKASQAYVDVKDTLWEIAIRHRASPDISSYQMMMALYKKNPHAFLNGNINNLKAGVVIDLPTEAEARAMSSKAAVSEVRRQTSAWKSGTKSSAPDKAPLDATKKDVKSEAKEADTASGPEKGQLKVLAPSDATDQKDAALSDTQEASEGDLEQKNQALEDQLSVSQESIDRLERDNAELKDTLSKIQEQLDSLTRLVELKDEQVATLQNELAKAKQAPPPPPPEESLLDKLMAAPEYLAGIAGGLLALFAGLFFFLRKKKSDDADDELEPISNSGQAPKVELDDETAEEMAALEAAADELAAADDDTLADALDEVTAADADDNLEAELDGLSGLDDLDDLDDLEDLDLDMDLDLDESLDSDLDALALDESEKAEASPQLDPEEEDLLGDILDDADDLDETVQDDEFDLGLDDLEKELSEADALADTAAELDDSDNVEDVDTALDDLLNESEDGLDELLGMDDMDDELQNSGLDKIEPLADVDDDDETLESLGIDLEDELEGSDIDEAVAEVASSETEDSLDDLDDLIGGDLEELDLDVDGLGDTSGVESGLDSELSADLDNLLAESEGLPTDTAVEVSDEMGDLDFDLDSLDAELEGDLASLDEEPQAEAVTDDADGLDFNLDDLDMSDLSEPEAAEVAEPEDSGEALDFDSTADLHPEVADLLSDPVDLDDEAPANAAMGNLDAAGVELDAEELLPNTPTDEAVTEELTSNIEHDLDAELDAELDALLNSTDNDIALEEVSSEEASDPVSAVSFLDNADEVETKLDLARAYIDMDDVDGAREILKEIADEGSDAQRAEANSLMEGLS